MIRSKDIKNKCGKAAAMKWIKRLEKLDANKRWNTAGVLFWDYVSGEHLWGKCPSSKAHMRDFRETLKDYRESHKPSLIDGRSNGFLDFDDLKASLLAIGYSEEKAIKRATQPSSRERELEATGMTKTHINTKGNKY
ncbi:hypothetical protein OAI07_01230 [Akkermansiaceae bacterium]|nr:hypothetical protein [Akkermansiaceae bacterium]